MADTTQGPPRADLSLLEEKVRSVMQSMYLLQSALGDSYPKPLADKLQLVNNFYEYYQREISSDLDKAVDAAEHLSTAARQFVSAITDSEAFSSKGTEEAGDVTSKALDLSEYCAKHTVSVKRVPVIASASPNFGSNRAQFANAPYVPAESEAVGNLEALNRSMASVEARLVAIGAASDKLSERVEQSIANLSVTARTAIDTEVSKFSEGYAQRLQAADTELSAVRKIRADAQAVATDVAISALAKGYAGSSGDEKTQANLFRWISLGVMAVVTVVVLVSLIQLTIGKLEWPEALVRLGLSLVLTIPAGYTARESAKHRAQSVDLRKISLDFAALAPYLETVSEPEKTQLKSEIAKRFFFTDTKSDSSSSMPIDPQQLAMRAMDIAADAVKNR